MASRAKTKTTHCRIKPPYPDKELASVVEGGLGELDKSADNRCCFGPTQAIGTGSDPLPVVCRRKAGATGRGYSVVLWRIPCNVPINLQSASGIAFWAYYFCRHIFLPITVYGEFNIVVHCYRASCLKYARRSSCWAYPSE